MDKSEARRATRKTIVEKIDVQHSKRGEPSFPPTHLMRGNDDASEAWTVFQTTRTGLRPPRVSTLVFIDREELDSYLRDIHEGDELSGNPRKELIDEEYVQQLISTNSLMGVAAGDGEYSLAYDVLGDAGILAGRYGPLSEEVKDILGQKRIDALKKSFGENWTIGAAYEFCWVRMPHSSPAFIAASYHYNRYIIKDNFAAGYHWRDLEVLVYGIEEIANRAIERSKKAGQSGSKKSTQARNLRRASIMDAMEAVCQRNPDIANLGEEPISQLALREAVQRDTSLWSQGRGQVREYLGEIRRGEAGAGMQGRYIALFGNKPPKRLQV